MSWVPFFVIKTVVAFIATILNYCKKILLIPDDRKVNNSLVQR